VQNGAAESTAFTYEPEIQRLNATLTNGDLNHGFTVMWA